jgi:ADP-heptose:LPS heptosyltransferase
MTDAGPPVREARAVAVLRALQLGDLLCAVPALRALRNGLPQAEITLVSLGWARAFAERFSRYVDSFLELPGYPGLPERLPDVAAVPPFLADAQARSFDLVVQLHGSGEATNPLAVLLGGRRTAGFYRAGAYCPDPELFLVYPEDGPEPRRLLRLVELLGIQPAGEHLEFPLFESDRRALADIPAAAGLSARPYACIHPGSRLESRRWAPARFAAVGDYLAGQGLQVVLTGSGSEREVTARVGGAMEAHPLDLAGETSLGALAALLSGAQLLVCNDTGVSHLAAALDVPSVVVFTVSDPVRWAPSDARKHRVVPPAHATVERVVNALEALLGPGKTVKGV